MGNHLESKVLHVIMVARCNARYHKVEKFPRSFGMNRARKILRLTQAERQEATTNNGLCRSPPSARSHAGKDTHINTIVMLASFPVMLGRNENVRGSLNLVEQVFAVAAGLDETGIAVAGCAEYIGFPKRGLQGPSPFQTG